MLQATSAPAERESASAVLVRPFSKLTMPPGPSHCTPLGYQPPQSTQAPPPLSQASVLEATATGDLSPGKAEIARASAAQPCMYSKLTMLLMQTPL